LPPHDHALIRDDLVLRLKQSVLLHGDDDLADDRQKLKHRDEQQAAGDSANTFLYRKLPQAISAILISFSGAFLWCRDRYLYR
jgi:hypothetical protein